jgi:peptidoglycan/xylan/chitin deacetylase (PgdA/CDA1 family)
MHYSGGLKRLSPTVGCAVVNYHGVFPSDFGARDRFIDGNLVSPEQLQKQLRFLKTDYEVIAPADFRRWIHSSIVLPPRAVLITCDDGLASNLDMLPILRDEGVRCLFFITGASCSENPGILWYEELYHILRSGTVEDGSLERVFGDSGKPPSSGALHSVWWNAVLSASRLNREDRTDRIRRLGSKCKLEPKFSQKRGRLLDVNEVQQLSKADMSIGAHTMSHPVLSETNDAESFGEIRDSKLALEHALQQPVWAFAYPFGNPATMGKREVGLARKAGFECAFINEGAGFSRCSNPFKFPRTHITADMSTAELEAHMIGFHMRLQRALRG